MTQDNASLRRLPIWGFLVIVVGYLAAIHYVPRLVSDGSGEYGVFTSVSDVASRLMPAAGLGAVIALVIVAILGWWRPVFRDTRGLPRWTWIFPGFMLAAILVGTAYGSLADKGAGFTATLLVSALLVGLSEETLFRGIGVTVFRQAGHSEVAVALWTSLIFGLAHATNIFSEGVGAIPQVLTTAMAGYFFYITRRVSGTLIAPIILHGLWDFGLFSNQLTDEIGLGAGLFIIVDVVLLIVAIATFRKVFPKAKPAA
jgi:hypothetical protein